MAVYPASAVSGVATSFPVTLRDTYDNVIPCQTTDINSYALDLLVDSVSVLPSLTLACAAQGTDVMATFTPAHYSASTYDTGTISLHILSGSSPIGPIGISDATCTLFAGMWPPLPTTAPLIRLFRVKEEKGEVAGATGKRGVQGLRRTSPRLTVIARHSLVAHFQYNCGASASGHVLVLGGAGPREQ